MNLFSAIITEWKGSISEKKRKFTYNIYIFKLEIKT